MIVADEQVAPLRELYEQGQYLTAFERCRKVGPIDQWEGLEARLFAGRLATHLGAPRLGRAIHHWCWRHHPREPEACYFGIWALCARRGPWAAWKQLERLEGPLRMPPRREAEFCALRAHMLALLRDFENADAQLKLALELDPRRPWIYVERAAVLDLEDRHEQALEVVEQALEMRPWYRPAVQWKGHHLAQQNRDDEALEFLRRAGARLESGDVLAQLAALQTELQQFDEARQTYERLEAYYPLIERDKRMTSWLRARRADAAYYCGDLEEAARRAAEVDTPFFDAMARRLEQGAAAGKRVVLDVGFVRQHHMTCAPATLSALSRYWKRPVEHLEIVEAICYDGTPAHSERRWAERQGYHVREFRVTWDAAVALLDRGAPFTLTLVGPGAGHLQAVIGYDQRRGGLLVRDPNERYASEFLAEKMLEYYCSTGPRGMVILPESERERLAGVELPDAELYDHNYELQKALEVHDRAAAETHWRHMETLDAEHRLTIHARGVIAHYDADLRQLLDCANRLLERFPDDANQLLTKLRLLREFGRRDERLKLLEEICAKPRSHPVFWHQYARELLDDGRRRALGRYWLRRAMRARPGDASDLRLTAGYLWEQNERDEALRMFRFAACLEDKNEAFSMAYFNAARHCNQADAARRFLEDRFARFGARSGCPARTLAAAHDMVERTDRALRVLEEAVELRPDDGDLLLDAADMHARYGHHERGAALLRRARPAAHRTRWWRAAARLALYRGDLERALDHARRALEAEPLDRETHDLAADLLRDLEGPEAAEAHLRQALEMFPHHYELRVSLIERIGRETPEKTEAEVRELLRLHPSDPWGRRELAIALTARRRMDEALSAARLAVELDAHNPESSRLLGAVLQAMGRGDEARKHYLAAIRLSIDCEPAIAGLMDLCDSKAEREETLALIHQELKRQVTLGDGLLLYRDYAADTLEPNELLRILREARAAREDLWQTWSALTRQLVEMERRDEAREMARAGAERFPLLPRMWLDLARACQAAEDDAGEVEALRRALSINPRWGDALRQLAYAYERSGDLENAEKTLRRAVAASPRDASNQGALADVLWQQERRDEAIDAMRAACKRAPGYEWGWEQLRAWAREIQQPELPLELAREVARQRPRRVSAWLLLAETLAEEGGRWNERLEALDRALALNPFHVEALDARATTLADADRFDEAVAACRPEGFSTQPLALRARQADIEAYRGNYDAAHQLMRSVVADDPDYIWAWYRLTSWAFDRDDADAQREAARELTRLMPQNPMGWGYLGDAQNKLGQRDDAKQSLRESLRCDAEYGFGASALFRIHLEDGEWEEAEATLENAEPALTADFRLALALQLDAKRGDPQAAAEHFDQLCHAPIEDPDAVEVVSKTLRNWERAPEVATQLARLLREGEAAPQLGELWTDLAARGGRFKRALEELRQFDGEGEAWGFAARRLIGWLAAGERMDLLDKFARKQRAALRRDTRTWAAVGQAYADGGRWRAAVKWLDDWRRREEVGADMLYPLLLAQLRLRRHPSAEETARAAIALPEEPTRDFHRLWLTLLLIRRGETQEAADVFSRIVTRDFGELRLLLRATLEILRRPVQGDDKLSWRDARERLDQARLAKGDDWRGDELFRRAYHLCRQRVARRHRRPIAAALARLQAESGP